MKKIIPLFLLVLLITGCITGCSIRRDTMEDINIYTTAYPIEYITNYLYGDHSNIKSIYPRGVINKDYELTDIEIKNYSKGDLFIFDGLGKEQSYINSMLKNNKNLKIIDATKTIYYQYNEDELWLNPSNILMTAKNIKDGLDEYISNKYLKNNIATNYEELKLTISKLEAKIYLMVEECDYKTIVVSNDALGFLSKYGLEVISIDKKNTLYAKNSEIVKNLVANKKISYVFTLSGDEKNDTIKTIEKNVSLVSFKSVTNLSETDLKENKNYLSIMNDNVDLLRAEIYND